MIDNAIYRLASVTKPVVAATALAMVDKELIGFQDRWSTTSLVRARLKDGRAADITIHHLLTHTAGLAYSYPEDPEISTG